MLKKFLENNGILEKQPEETTVKPKPQPVTATPNRFVQTVQSDEKVYDKLLQQIDVHKGYSFVEFYQTNKDNSSIKSALDTFLSITGLSRENLLMQSAQVISKLDNVVESFKNKLENQKQTIISNADNDRQVLLDKISKLEQELNESKQQLSSINVNSETSDTLNKINVLTNTYNTLKQDLNNFINKI